MEVYTEGVQAQGRPKDHQTLFTVTVIGEGLPYFVMLPSLS